MPERLPPHTHCIQCDNPVPEGEEYCSEECKATYQKRMKDGTRRSWIFFAVVVVIMVLMAMVTVFAV